MKDNAEHMTVTIKL